RGAIALEGRGDRPAGDVEGLAHRRRAGVDGHDAHGAPRLEGGHVDVGAGVVGGVHAHVTGTHPPGELGHHAAPLGAIAVVVDGAVEALQVPPQVGVVVSHRHAVDHLPCRLDHAADGGVRVEVLRHPDFLAVVAGQRVVGQPATVDVPAD